MFEKQEPGQRSAHETRAGPDPVPVWLDQIRELSEYWLHRQQLLHALDRPADVQTAVVGPILDGFRWAYPYRLSDVVSQPGDTVSIEISGPVTATWHLVAMPAGWEFQPSQGARLVASLAMTTDQAWRLLSNNLPMAEQARLRIEGDANIVAILRQTRAIIGAPT
jgi:hypothetical protein